MLAHKTLGTLNDIYYELLAEYEYRYWRLYKPIGIPKHASFIVPVWGNIELNERVLKFIFLPIVQRLNRIRQLTYVNALLTGAAHTRLEHSLGVLAIVSRVIEYLKGELKLTELEEEILKIAAILHDIGHGGWGHALDGVNGLALSIMTEAIGSRTFTLFNVKKLDITLALYLLQENDQLKQAFDELARFHAEEIRVEGDVLRRIAALVIAEEWDAIDSEVKGSDEEIEEIFKRVARLGQTIIGAPKGVGGFNADRVDWILRDAHHTMLDARLENSYSSLFVKVKNIVSDELSKYIEIDKDDYKVSLNSEIVEKINKIREKMYKEIYEDPSKAFCDALLMRSAYSAIRILEHVGGSISSPSILLRVLMSYILQPDVELKRYTMRILKSAKIWIRDTNEAKWVFLLRSTDLCDYLDHIEALIHSLRYNDSYNDREFKFKIVKTIFSLNPDKKYSVIFLYMPILVNVLRQLNNVTLHGVYQNIIWGGRLNPIDQFDIAEIEAQLVRGFDLYLLVNYYAFRKLDDYYNRLRPKNIQKLFELIEKKLREEPFLFILINKDNVSYPYGDLDIFRVKELISKIQQQFALRLNNQI